MTELMKPVVIERIIKLRITVTSIGCEIPDDEMEDFKDWVCAKVANDITVGKREEYRLGDDPKDDFPVEFNVEVL